MTYPESYLIHSCTIGASKTQTPCRFYTPSPYLGLPGFERLTRCTIPGSPSVDIDTQITTTTEGYAGTYWVNHIHKVYEPAQDSISHTILELRQVEYREAAS